MGCQDYVLPPFLYLLGLPGCFKCNCHFRLFLSLKKNLVLCWSWFVMGSGVWGDWWMHMFYTVSVSQVLQWLGIGIVLIAFSSLEILAFYITVPLKFWCQLSLKVPPAAPPCKIFHCE